MSLFEAKYGMKIGRFQTKYGPGPSEIQHIKGKIAIHECAGMVIPRNFNQQVFDESGNELILP